MEYLVITRDWSLFDRDYHEEFMEVVVADSKDEVIEIINNKYNKDFLDAGRAVIKIYELKKIYDMQEATDELLEKLSEKNSKRILTTDITPMDPELEKKLIAELKKKFEMEKAVEIILDDAVLPPKEKED